MMTLKILFLLSLIATVTIICLAIASLMILSGQISREEEEAAENRAKVAKLMADMEEAKSLPIRRPAKTQGTTNP